jgi:xanthine/uracil/vitamin C permease (AzgA family)
MSKQKTITVTLSEKEYTLPSLTVWELEQLQEHFYNSFGKLSATDLSAKLQEPAVVMRLTTTILTLLFDAAGLIPAELTDAPFEKQRKHVARLVDVEDLQNVADAIASGMPGALKSKLEDEFPKA